MIRYVIILLWCCGTSQVVKCSTASKIKKEIQDMHENAKVLEEENKRLAKILEGAKQRCEEELRPFREQQAESEGYQREAATVLVNLAGNITQKQQEEEYLIKALHREYIIHNKYSLQIELYNQELDTFEDRKRTGLADGCHSLRAVFPDHEAAFAPRSMGFKPESTAKNSIVVLENELNSAKIVVQALETKNQIINKEIENIDTLCAAQKQDLILLVKSTESELREILINVDLFEEELEKYIKVVEQYTIQLQELKETNKELKAESSRRKDTVKSFEKDLECYTEMANLKINYPQNILTH